MKTENEQKKEFLQSYQIAKWDVARLELQLQELQQNKISPNYMIGDGMPHGHNLSDLSEYAAKVDMVEREIMKVRYQRITAYEKVKNCIESMQDEREKSLLTYRYIKGYSWEKIAVKMNYSIRKIYYIHGQALKNFVICA